MGLLATIVVGLIAGLLASWIMKSLLTGSDLVTGFNLTSILVALGGAIVVIFIYRLIKR